MEKQIHLEFQRLKEELDKIASYSHMMHRAEENVHKTTQLINQVGEKYESLVDLIWHEFNAELESLNLLKENITAEVARLQVGTDTPVVASLDSDSSSTLVSEVLEALHAKFEGLDEKLKSQYQTLEGYVSQIGVEHQQLEQRLQEKIDTQLESLSTKINSIGEDIKGGLLEVIDDLPHKTAAEVSLPDFKEHPLQNGLGEDLKNQIEQLKAQINQSDTHLESIIKGSLESSFSSFIHETQAILQPLETEIEAERPREREIELMEFLGLVQQRLANSENALNLLLDRINGSDDLGQSILDRLSISDETLQGLKESFEGKEGSSSQELISIRESLDKLIQEKGSEESSIDLEQLTQNFQNRLNLHLDTKLDSKFSQVDSKLNQTEEQLSQTVSGINQSVQSTLQEISTQSNAIQKTLGNLEGRSGNEGLETLKKVSRNQLQKLLDNETDLKKQRQLLGIVTVISILNLLLIILVIFSLYQ